jgi:hypothetical protein
MTLYGLLDHIAAHGATASDRALVQQARAAAGIVAV